MYIKWLLWYNSYGIMRHLGGHYEQNKENINCR